MHVLKIIFLLASFAVGTCVQAAIKTSAVAEGFSLISTDYDLSPKSFALLGLHLRSDSNDKFEIDFSGRYAAGSSVLSYLNVREFSYRFDITETASLYTGRKLMNWSAIDNIWNLGVIQPQFKWNQLSPLSQGLTGLFWDQNEAEWGYTLFASPLYIPDQGAGYEIKDGQFQSGNPFFRAPPQNIRFQGQLLPIDYNIARPEASEVVSQSMFGAQFRLGSDTGYFARIAGIYKPSNQLALGYKGILVTTRVRVDVLPKTYYETDYSLDAGYRAAWGYAQISVVATNPKSPEFDPAYNHPVFESAVSAGPQVVYKWGRFQFLLAHLETSGGAVKDEGPDVGPNQQSLSERFLVKQATLVKAVYSDIYKNVIRWDSTAHFKFSTSEKWREIRFKNTVNFRNPWSVWLDVILVDTDSSVDSNFEPYKNFDQAWLGVSYDF